MRSILAVSLMLAVFSGVVAPAFAQTIGIVLLHGKTGSPDTPPRSLVAGAEAVLSRAPSG
jgi:hypothetical protein